MSYNFIFKIHLNYLKVVQWHIKYIHIIGQPPPSSISRNFFMNV